MDKREGLKPVALSKLSNLRRGWTPPPELNGPESRAVRLTGNGISFLIMGLIFAPAGVAVLVALILLSRHEQAMADRMAAEGRQVDAAVTKKWHTPGGYRSGPHYHLDYRFTADGKQYVGDGDVSYAYWWNTNLGALIPVRYLPSDPHFNYPPDFPPTVTPLFFAILMGGIFLGPGLLCLAAVRRQWRLLKYGCPVPAIVTKTRSVRAKYGRTMVGDYEFELTGGGTGRSRHSVEMYHPTGSVISIVYDPKNPRRNSPYPIPKPVLLKMAGL